MATVTLVKVNDTLRHVLESSCRLCVHFNNQCEHYDRCKANRPLGAWPPFFERRKGA